MTNDQVDRFARVSFGALFVFAGSLLIVCVLGIAGAFGSVSAQTTFSSATGLKYTSAGATEDEHAVKATPGAVYSITATNINAAVRYLRCANATAANTAPGTTTPVIDLAIPAAAVPLSVSFPHGFTFSTALTCWLVTGAADTDVAEVAANELKVVYTYR